MNRVHEIKSRADLGEQDGGEYEVGALLVLDDVGVVGHAEDRGLGDHGQALDELEELAMATDVGHAVLLLVVEVATALLVVAAAHDILPVVPRQDGDERTPVPLVGHAPSVVALAFAETSANLIASLANEQRLSRRSSS